MVTVCGAALPAHAPLGSHANQRPIANPSLSAELRLSGAWPWPADKGLLAGHIPILGQASLQLDAVRPRPGIHFWVSLGLQQPREVQAPSQGRRAPAGLGSGSSPAPGQRARRLGVAGGNGWRRRGGGGPEPGPGPEAGAGRAGRAGRENFAKSRSGSPH